MNDGHKVAEEWVKEDLHQNSNIFGDDVLHHHESVVGNSGSKVLDFLLRLIGQNKI